AADYTHRTEFDDLGRTVKITPAVRDLSVAERDEFKAGPGHVSTFAYDSPHASLDAAAGHANHTIGRLTSAVSPAATTITGFNEFGLPTVGSQRLNDLPGLSGLSGIGDTLQTAVSFDETGLQPTTIQYSARNSAGQTVFTGPAVHASGFDRDGAPTATSIDLGSRGTMAIAVDRNAAGAVTARRTNTGGLSEFSNPLTRYNRDRYGRLTSQETVAFGENDTEIQRYKQTLDYYDNGQISQIKEQLGDTTQPEYTTDYSYNHRGELSSAWGNDYAASLYIRASGRLDYAGVFDLTLAQPAQAPIPGRRITSRFANYRYQDPAAGGDPLRLTALHVDDETEDGLDLATYLYDEAGNTTNRSVTNPDNTATTYTQRWDGPSSLRKVTNSSTGQTETYFHDAGTRVAAIRKNADGTINSVRRYFGAQEIVYTPGQQPAYRQNLTLAGDTIGRIDGDAETGTLEHYTTTVQGHHVLALAAQDAATRRVTRYGAFG
ncbi:hypothetical protein, partial [Catellatospora sp. NPDC049609]|uniref:hypothetical protein n=1 Tax=Catellatospora sp. NPDC049609 TaxID=3155505 RepID=UPI00341870A0